MAQKPYTQEVQKALQIAQKIGKEHIHAGKEAILIYNSNRLHTSLGFKTPDSVYFAESA